MKLWCQLPRKVDPKVQASMEVGGLLERDYALVKRIDTEVALKPLEHGSSHSYFGYEGLRFLHAGEILKSVLRAEKERFDGVIITCYFDPGLEAARAMLEIPVVGAGESSMHVACMIGSRFAIITLDATWAPGVRKRIGSYGMTGYVIERNPVRWLTLSPQDYSCSLQGDYAAAIKNFKRVALGCIEDGADVLIVGCGPLAAILTQGGLKEIDGVPVVDPNVASIKLAEMMVDLHKAGVSIISRKGLYLLPPLEDREAAKELL